MWLFMRYVLFKVSVIKYGGGCFRCWLVLIIWLTLVHVLDS